MTDSCLQRMGLRSELVFEGTVQLPSPVVEGFVLYRDANRARCFIASDIFEAMLASGQWMPGAAVQ